MKSPSSREVAIYWWRLLIGNYCGSARQHQRALSVAIYWWRLLIGNQLVLVSVVVDVSHKVAIYWWRLLIGNTY